MSSCYLHLEERLDQLCRNVCSPECKKCRDAKISRLEYRAHALASEQRSKRSPEKRFFDANPGDFYPQGLVKRNCKSIWHSVLDKLPTQQYPIAKTANSEPNKTPDANANQKESHVTTPTILHEQDELLRFKRKLEESEDGSTPQSIFTESPKSSRGYKIPKHCEYYQSIYNIDVATLRAHRGCYDPDTTARRIKESKNVKHTRVETKEPSTVSDKIESIFLFQPPTGFTSTPTLTSTTSQDTEKEQPKLLETPKTSDESIKEKPSTNDLFGAKTMELINRQAKATLGEGNPLFAPGATTESVFSQVSDFSKSFVFGASDSSAPLQPQATTPQIQQHAQITPMMSPMPPAQINIPGFEAAAAPTGDLANNPFMASFTRQRRGGRSRGSRSRMQSMD
ncbi:hypothetical protein BdWA1_002044 [Babesia duncani]|uniref:Uncharacterized protein n=1 Tax=Babesia duncani TaxID=323732 RepID=A0AAD9UPH4_9APIC|nr:hypothetical protein BdWA1_003525 [Babesia duncani]KAK2196795.1 hypothetical protein BdWA1_002044 [Babesia duncani]